MRRRVVWVLMRRSGEDAAARNQHEDRGENQRQRNIYKRHGVPPSMDRLFSTKGTHCALLPHEKAFDQAISSSASVVSVCGSIKPASTVGSSAVSTVIGSTRPRISTRWRLSKSSAIPAVLPTSSDRTTRHSSVLVMS